MTNYDTTNSSSILDSPIPMFDAPILIPEKFNRRFPKLNSNRLRNFENRFNSRLNYIIKSKLRPIIINTTYNKLISSINNFIRPKPPIRRTSDSNTPSFEDFDPNLF